MDFFHEINAEMGVTKAPANVWFRDATLCALCQDDDPTKRSTVCGCKLYCRSCSDQLAAMKDRADADDLQRSECPLHTTGVQIRPCNLRGPSVALAR